MRGQEIIMGDMVVAKPWKPGGGPIKSSVALRVIRIKFRFEPFEMLFVPRDPGVRISHNLI